MVFKLKIRPLLTQIDRSYYINNIKIMFITNDQYINIYIFSGYKLLIINNICY